MFVHKENGLTVYFGDKEGCRECWSFIDEKKYRLDFCYPDNKIVFLHQLHTDKGYIVSDMSVVNFLTRDRRVGDYLVTNLVGLQIGVITADCLPIVFYDPVRKVAAIVHAGWRGSRKRIVEKVLHAMRQEFGCFTKNILAYLGPCIKSCCYEVSSLFINYFSQFSFAEKVFSFRDGKLYFSLPAFNYFFLQKLGIPANNICMKYNVCTFCNWEFESFRRQGKAAARQVSMVVLT